MTNKGAIREVGERRGAFALAFISIFILTFVFLHSVGVTPDPMPPKALNEPVANTGQVPATVSSPQMPVRVVAKDVDLDVTIVNPTSTDVAVLDQALLKGAVRYPTSAQLGVDGTVLLFGHSSYLPVVHNQAYKAFDDIQNLKTGQIIHVYSGDTDYQYSVVGVKVADANQDSIELTPQGKHLTLVTCDSFTTKSNRFIVTADFVGAYSLVSN